MISKCNNDDLQQNKVDRKYFLLFQNWKELTNVNTLDTYQFRVMNTLSGIQELLIVIDQKLQALVKTNHNVVDSRNELREIIKRDSSLKGHYPVVYQRLLSHLNTKVDTDAELKALRHRLKYLYEMIAENYYQYTVEDLEEAIESGNKELQVSITNRLVSCCVTKGWSVKALNKVIELLYDSELGCNAWNQFKSTVLSREQRTYTIYIPIKVKILARQFKGIERQVDLVEKLSNFGIDTQNSNDLISSIQNKKASSMFEKNQLYAVIKQVSFDSYSASLNAINKLSNATSVLSFYNYIDAWQITALKWIVVDEQSLSFQQIRADDIYGKYLGTERAQSLIDKSRKLMQRDTSIKAKLISTFSYSNMGCAASAQEEKYINTWIALESLCRSDIHENIINNVLDVVPPALCRTYIYKIYRNFIEDCKRCDVSFNLSTGPLFNNNSSNRDKVKELIDSLKNQCIASEFGEACKCNDLLYYRYNEILKLVNDVNATFSKIEKHYNNIKLQLSRLYRIRNEIAHNAFGLDQSLSIFNEHLYDYLSGTVTEIVMCADKNQIDDIYEVFERIKDNYNEFKDIIQLKKGANAIELLEELTDTGIINLI